jgi:hypothetical protein
MREDANSGSKSYRVRILSPQKNGISFDSGVIKDYADGKSLIEFNEESLNDLLEDAIFYVVMAPDLDPGLFGLVQSARATIRAIEKIKLEQLATK